MVHWVNGLMEKCSLVRPSCLYGSTNNSAQFAIFRDNVVDRVRRKQRTLTDHLKPDGRFVQFFKNDFEFVNEVGSAFRSTRFTVIRGNGCPRSEDLGADVASLSRSWQ